MQKLGYKAVEQAASSHTDGWQSQDLNPGIQAPVCTFIQGSHKTGFEKLWKICCVKLQ